MTKDLSLLRTEEDEVSRQKIEELANWKLELFVRELELLKQAEESRKMKRESKRPMKSWSSDDEFDIKESKKRKIRNRIESKQCPVKKSLALTIDDEDRYKTKMQKQKHKKIQKEIEKRLSNEPLISNEVTKRLKEFISNVLKGSDIKPVIQKLLYLSDTRQNQNRLSMPINQVIKTSVFLTPHEKNILANKGVLDVPLLGPTLQMYKLPMKLMIWDMESTQSYVLKTNWYSFVKDNDEDLKERSIVQVWSFRIGEQLCLAVAVVEGPDPRFFG